MSGYPLDPKPNLHVMRISFDGDCVSCGHPQYGCNPERAPDGTFRGVEGHHHRDPNVDGSAWYELEFANGRFAYYRQPFAQGAAKKHPFDTCVKKDGTKEPSSIWSWNGDVERPTVTPSFLCEDYPPGCRVHLYLTNGAIDLLADSTVVLG